MADTMSVEMAEARSLWWIPLVQGIIGILLGLMFLSYPGATAAVVAGMVGFFWLVGGIMDIVALFVDRTAWGWKLFSGIIGILAGFIVVSGVFDHPLYTAAGLGGVYVIILGIQGIVIGVIQIVRAFQGEGWGIGVLGGVSILFGGLLLANIWMAVAVLPWVFGVFGIVGGIFAIVMAFRLKNA